MADATGSEIPVNYSQRLNLTIEYMKINLPLDYFGIHYMRLNVRYVPGYNHLIETI